MEAKGQFLQFSVARKLNYGKGDIKLSDFVLMYDLSGNFSWCSGASHLMELLYQMGLMHPITQRIPANDMYSGLIRGKIA